MSTANMDETVAEGDEEVQGYEEIEKLQELGVNAQDIKRLKEAGVHTVQALFMQTKRRMGEIKGMSEAKVDKLMDTARKIHAQDFVTGSQMKEKRAHVLRITTGSTALDSLLGGGVESASITEFRTGKTQLAHTLCVTAQLPRNLGGGNGKVVYIDTEGSTFRPDRICAIADRFEVDGNSVLENILVARASDTADSRGRQHSVDTAAGVFSRGASVCCLPAARYNHEQQMSYLTAVAAKMVEERFALIIVDSCTALFRVDFAGRGTLSERQQKLGQHLSALIKLAEEFNVAVYLTNQVQSDPSGGMAMFGDQKKPIGGNIMAHACTTRLQLKKGRGEQRTCKVYDSPCLPETECIYQLGEGGVLDAKD